MSNLIQSGVQFTINTNENVGGYASKRSISTLIKNRKYDVETKQALIDNENEKYGGFSINAVDIDWNEAKVNNNQVIKNTGDLLNWVKSIEEKADTEIEQGPQGSKGEAGEPGVKGPQGDKGTQGIQGAQGAKGIQGNTGMQGVRGAGGAQGVRGIQGTKGEAGDKGPQGDAGTFDSSTLENYATKEFVGQEIAKVVGEAPETLDTLKELADALNDNATMTQVTEALSTKANTNDVYTKNDIDAMLAEIETTPGQQGTPGANGEQGPQGPKGDQGDKGDTGTFDSSELESYATKTYVDGLIAEIVGGEDVSANFDTLKELADAMEGLKVVDVEAQPAIAGEHYTQEEIDAAQDGDDAYGKTTEDWKVQPVEAVPEQSHNMTISEFVNNSIQTVDEKAAVAKVQSKYEALLALLNVRESQVNSVIINQELQESSNVTFDEVVNEVIIPETTAAYTVSAPLEDDSTVTLTSNKYMTLFNTSEEPVSTTIQYDAGGATGSGTTVYLVGEYDTLTLENISPNVKSGQDPAKVNNVVITEDNTKNLTLTLDLQDGAVITNNSATDVTISDKNNEATVLTVVAPNSTVTLNGGTFETLNATVSDNTLIIKKTAHIGDLIVNHGNVKVEVPRESDISNIITGKIVLGDPKSSLIVDHNNYADAYANQLVDYYNNYPTEAAQDGPTWPAFTPSKFPWLVINHNFNGDTEVTVYYQGEKVFGDWKPSAKITREDNTEVDRTYAILSVPEDLGLTMYTESTAGNEILLNPEDIEVRLVNNKVDYLHDEITSANVSKLTSTGTHVLTEDIAKNGRFAPGIFASDDIIWDLNGHNITFTNTQGYANFLLRGTLHLEINGEGAITNNAGDYGFWTATEGAKVVINGGTYYAATHVLYAEKGTIEVNGGEFHLTDGDTADKDANGNFKFLLNCLDASYTAGTANIIVRGGKFYGFNPAETYGEPNGPVSYVAEGYGSIKIGEENGLNIYEVRPTN